MCLHTHLVCGVIVRSLSRPDSGRLYLIENNTFRQLPFELPDLAVSSYLRSQWVASGDNIDSMVFVQTVFYTFTTSSDNEMVFKDVLIQGIAGESFFYYDRGTYVHTGMHCITSLMYTLQNSM